jgi:DNA-binding MarR family transcriptional regulator
MGELSEQLGRGLPSVTSMVDRLVKKSLVERVQDPSDRRVVACRLTEQGTDAVERFWQVSRDRRLGLADGLTAEELETVVPALETLTQALARRETEAPASVAEEVKSL